MNEWEKYSEAAVKSFKDHKATLVQDSDRFTIIDWKKMNGSSDYYINFIVDKKRGSLIVSGDLGESIATWYNPLTVSDLKTYIYKDIPYYMSKFCCTSDGYYYDDESVLEDILDGIFGTDDESDDAKADYIENSDFECFEYFKSELEDEIIESIHNDDFYPTERLKELVEDAHPDDAWELFAGVGKKIRGRVYLWAIGFKMACDQLGM